MPCSRPAWFRRLKGEKAATRSTSAVREESHRSNYDLQVHPTTLFPDGIRLETLQCVLGTGLLPHEGLQDLLVRREALADIMQLILERVFGDP